MAFKDKLDYSETVEKHRIVFKTKWMELLDIVVFYFAGTFFIICLCLSAYEISKSDNPSLLGYGLILIAIVFSIFAGYKKVFEKKLRTIPTNMSKTEVRNIVQTFAKEQEWKILNDNADFFRGYTGIEITSWGKVITIIYDNDKIHVNVLSDNPVVRMPLLFADKAIKKEIEGQFMKAMP